MLIKDFAAKYDPQKQFEVLKNSFTQIEYAWNNKYDLKEINKNEIKNIIVTGLGGSAISADLLQNYLGSEIQIPLIVNRNYFCPPFADSNTLCIVSSYSGNTEESISAMKDALAGNCRLIALSTGGVIEKLSAQNKIPFVKLMKGFQPRFALGLSFFSILKVLQGIGFISDQSSITDKIIRLWKRKADELSSENNPAYNIAQQLIGYIPVIYAAADITSAVGCRFKCQFNENSKMHAFYNSFPEMNHNEIVPWEFYQEKAFPVKVIFILDKSYHPQVKKRFEIISGLLQEKGIEIIRIESSEDDFKVRLLDLIYFTDWITYYAAILRGFDPTEINFINILKERLA